MRTEAEITKMLSELESKDMDLLRHDEMIVICTMKEILNWVLGQEVFEFNDKEGNHE